MLRILGVFAHPADMVTECGGTLARHAEAGDEVVCVIITHGGRIHPTVYVEDQRRDPSSTVAATRDDVIARKHAEVERAASILGLERVVYLDHEDSMISVDGAIVREVADVIAEVRPHVFVTHHPGFTPAYGNDHCIAGQIAVAATGLAHQRFEVLDDGAPAHFVKQTYFISVGVSSRSTTTPGGGPVNDVYVDISSVVERKIRAMDEFVSQGYNGDFARKCVAGHNGHWGSMAGVPYAEAFMRGAVETYDLLPVAERILKRDEHTMHRDYSRVTNPWSVPQKEQQE